MSPTKRRTRRRLASFVSMMASLFGFTAGAPAGADPVIVAAGDIACANQPCDPQRRTARLIGRIGPRAVLTLGDNQYPDGALADFLASYDRTWGRFKRRTHPSPGNHDYHTPRAQGYFDYFGRRAHRRSGGRYSFNLGRWHLISINSGRGWISDRQLRWVGRNLRKDRHRCEVAYWHHPRWSSGSVHGSNPNMARLWRVLYRRGVDVVLNGHEHSYERFTRKSPSGRWAPRTGIRQFVVGTGGGGGLYPMGTPIRGSQKRIDDKYGVLRMTLHPRSYGWAFIGAGGRVLDSGRSPCHR